MVDSDGSKKNQIELTPFGRSLLKLSCEVCIIGTYIN